MRITNPQHRLQFGTLDLLGADKSGPYYFEMKAEGTDWGNAEQIVRVIQTFLQDGAIQVVDGYGNRELTVELRIVGEDSYGLAAGENALFAETGKRNVLVWTPPNKITGAGTPCVFDVVSSDLDRGPLADLAEELRLKRSYKLTITALPFARSEELTTVLIPAPAGVTVSTTVIDACTAVTGNWAGSPNVPTVVGGTAIQEVATKVGSPPGTVGASLARTGLSTNMSTKPYVRIDYSVAFSGVYLGTGAGGVKINGVDVTAVARNGSVGWFQLPSGTTLNSVEISASASLFPGGTVTITIYDISQSNLPSDGTGDRQLFRTLPVGGSARTPGSLALADPAAALGTVIVYTTPDVGSLQQPPLRRLRTAGPTESTDTSLVSGKFSDLGTNHVFDIPAANIPSGGYQLVARIKHVDGGSKVLTWAAKSRMGSTNDAGQTGTQPVTLPAAAWAIVPVARLNLPTRRLGPAGLVRIELQAPAGVLLDEAWLFNVGSGRLTIVDCGTGAPAPGGPSNRLWIEAASIDDPTPQLWLGNAADRSDAFHAGAEFAAFAEHEFIPPVMRLFVVTTNSVGTGGSMSFYPRFHTHVVEGA